jgi:hypothetical protein
MTFSTAHIRLAAAFRQVRALAFLITLVVDVITS